MSPQKIGARRANAEPLVQAMSPARGQVASSKNEGLRLAEISVKACLRKLQALTLNQNCGCGRSRRQRTHRTTGHCGVSII